MKTTLSIFIVWALLLTHSLVRAQCPTDLYINSQTDIDNFGTTYPGCTEITGNLIIQGTTITSLDGLNGLTHIGGRVQIIGATNLTNVDGLSSLVSIGTFIDIYLNDSLTDLSGLGNVVFQPGFWSIVLESNPNLSVCNVPNICRYLANPSPSTYVAGNAAGCATISQIRSSCITPDANGILYVKKDGTGNGTSWTDALGEVSEAFAEAQTDLAIAQIWVAEGTYSATGTGLRMRNNLEIYGGFDPDNGIDDLTDQRISPSATTGSILTGDNIRRVVTNIFTPGNTLNDTAVLNGFTITKGNPPHTVEQMDLVDSGGGLLNVYASPKLVNLFVFDNYANDRGGGIYNYYSNPSLANIAVVRNSALYSGAGIYNYYSPAKIINSTIAYNQSARVGGIRNHGIDSQAVLKNSIVYGNIKTTANDPENQNLSNILNGAASLTNSLVQNVTTADAMGNIAGSVDPLFINATANNFRLLPCSPLINMGSNAAFAPGQTPDVSAITNDLDGNPRIRNTIDLGAYENEDTVITTLYVDATATGSNDGTSWSNAYTSFAEAVVTAHKCTAVDQILVAEGTYYPEYAIDYRSLNPLAHPKNMAFVFTRGNLEILGGYPNGGGTRNWKLHPTILSGNIGDPSIATDNAFHVMITVSSAVNNTFVFDGFTVTNGYANSSSFLDILGFSIPLDQGGGWYNLNGNPKISHTIISENTASSRGGGWYNNNGSPTITNTIISENHAFSRGGGWYNSHGNPQLTNTIICENRSNGYSGGWHNEAGNPILTNCTIGGNKNSVDPEGWRNESGNPVITNSIVYANGDSGINVISGVPVISYSLIQGLASTANGNLNGVTTNPLFRGAVEALPTDTPADNYRLMRCSPALDVGNNTVYAIGQTPDLSAIITDVDGNPRIQNLINGGIVDLGAYEKLDTTAPTGTLYVDASATGANDGSSWANAFTSMAKAVLLANSCNDITQILVAEGTYYPEYTSRYSNVNFVTTNRNLSFVFTRGGLEVLGGYPNGGGNRDWMAHPTILNGNIGDPLYDTDNAFHVVITAGTDNTFILDGFTITKGFANTVDLSIIFGSTIYDGGGGGWYNENGSPTVRNIVLTQNYGFLGGGVNNNGSAVVENVTVIENLATWGGGWYNRGGTPVIRNTIFSGNVGGGAGWFNNMGNPLIINSLISGNKTFSNGGGWYNSNGDPKIINTTITGNMANNGGGFHYVGGNPSITNSIIYGNQATTNPQINFIGALPTLSYSLVEGLSSTANGNLNGLTNNPLFLAPAPASTAPTTAGNYRLTRCSPLIDKGNNTVYAIGQTPDLSAITTDLDENTRIQNSIVDLGAYEIGSTSLTILYVDGTATGNNDGSSWDDAFTDFQSAVDAACQGDEVWVSQGEYQPALNNYFRMKEGVKIYGGFSGTETMLSERNWLLNSTVLKGNNNSVIRNECTVSSPMTNASMLNGFTIKDGLANQSPNPENILDTGGGIFNLYASPQLINLIVTNNTADDRGGGIYNRFSNPLIVNCVLSRNRANRSGGAIYNYSSSPTIVNSTVVYNTADRVGGIRSNYAQSAVILQNTIIYGNTQNQATLPEQANIANLDGATITYLHSFVQNITTADGQGNIDGALDPLFVNVPANNFRLLSCSPMLNAGTNTVYASAQTPDLSGITTDLDGNPRIQNTIVDLGAFETDSTIITTLYVDGTATGSNDGTSWANAYTSFAEAVVTAHKCTTVMQINVAEGTYYPEYGPFLSSVTDRNRCFLFRRGNLKVLGGYPNGGGIRNSSLHPTVLSGNIGDPSVDTDNAYHVVITYSPAVDQTFIFDGFTITKSNANSPSSSLVNNLDGGGWHNFYGSPAISNTIISGNYAERGGGFFNNIGNSTLTNVVLSGNSAIYGGGFYNMEGNSVLTNTTISGNYASAYGGGFRKSAAPPPTIKNCIIYGNDAPTSPGIYHNGALPTISYSLVQGLSDTTDGNLDGTTTNPQFVAPSLAVAAPTISGNYRLQANSPVINVANSALIPADITTDLDGNERIIGLSADMGAYEYQGAQCDYTTTWNGAAWSNGLPNADTKIIFDGDYTSDALNTNAGVLEGCSLEVISGLVIISEGHQLIIDHEVTIAGYDFFLKNNASLVQIQDDAINEGTLTYERITPPIYRYDYVYWSSPVTEDSNFLLGRNPADIYQHGLSRGTLFDKFHSWDTDQQAWSTILYGNEVMVPGKGYIVRAPQSYGTDPLDPASYNTFTGEFVGKPNNGLISIPIAGGINQWNLIGNPYPSALYIDAFLFENNTIVDGTIYIWTHSTAISNGGSGGIYNYDAGDYATYNLSGAVGTGLGDDAPNGGNVPSGYIASGQSFFIKGSTTGGSALFNNAMRVAGQNNQFFRPAVQNQSDENSPERHRIWLNLTGAQNAFRQMLVGYIENASNDLDWGYDGETFSTNSISFYSLLGDDLLAIQGRALPFNNEDEVPLGYKTAATGTFTISIAHVDGLFNEQAIYLEDTVLGVVHDLKASDYKFTTVAGTFNERFVLRYQASDLDVGEFENRKQKVVIAKDGNELVVKSVSEPLKEVSVYDILGRTILQKTSIQSKEIRMADVVLNTQALIVKVTLENGLVVTRKVIY